MAFVLPHQRLLPEEPEVAKGFGQAVAASEDGSTLLIGAPADDSGAGAVYVFVYDAGDDLWVQQDKIIPGDALTPSLFGGAVALSADGNTALIGGAFDGVESPNFRGGAMWVYTRNEFDVWSEEAKLFGDGTSEGAEHFGWQVALSADGATAIGCDYSYKTGDNGGEGYAFVYTIVDDEWEFEARLFPIDPHPIDVSAFPFTYDFLGPSIAGVALSADGDTAVISGPRTTKDGHFWTFRRSDGAWSQDGDGVGVEPAHGAAGGSIETIGHALSISNDGRTLYISIVDSAIPTGWIYSLNEDDEWLLQLAVEPVTADPTTAISGSAPGSFSANGDVVLVGLYVDTTKGRAWVFTRDGDEWAEQEQQIENPDIVDLPDGSLFGIDVALSSNARVAAVGAYGANAVWVYKSPAAFAVSLDVRVPLN